MNTKDDTQQEEEKKQSDIIPKKQEPFIQGQLQQQAPQQIQETTEQKEKREALEWIRQTIDAELRTKYMNKLGIKKKSFSFLSPSFEEDSTDTELLAQRETQLKVDNLFEQGEYLITFLSRSDEQVRNSYIKKLQSQNILKTNQTQKHQALVIFDWDDTILCTNYLSQYNFVDFPTEVLRQLSNLDNSAVKQTKVLILIRLDDYIQSVLSKLLRKTTQYGNTYIVTNAAKGWVEYSSKLFLPRVSAVIQETGIIVISARTEFEDVFPGDYYKWKIEAFKNLKRNYDEDLITNLICLGDSNIEIEAAHVLAKGFNQSMIKTIKFRDNPKPDELTKQQELVADKFEQIYVGVKNLTIRLENKYRDTIQQVEEDKTMVYSRLLSAEKLNCIKRTYLHDCRPIICEKEKIIEFWESLSLAQKERIFIVYDLNIVDEFVGLLSQVPQKESRQKATQMIKMPEKRVLLEFIYFEDLAGLLLDNHQLLHSFLRTICLISNKVTNDPQEISLEDADIPDCTDSALLQGRKKVLKFKIRAIMNMFEMLEMIVDSFCSGEKVLMRKRHYSSLFAQLISNNNSESKQISDSSEEIRVKLREILELLSIMFENNLIKAYLKATKHAAARQDGNESEIKSAKELRIGVLEREDSLKIRKNTIEENKQEITSNIKDDCADKEGIKEEKVEKQDLDNAGIQEQLDKHQADQASHQVASDVYHISPIEKDDSHQIARVSAEQQGSHLENLHHEEQQKQSFQCEQQLKIIKGEYIDNESQSEHSNNKLSANLTAEEQDLLEEQQKRECMQEIERQFELEREAAAYLEMSESNISKDDQSETNNKQLRLKSFRQSDVETVSKSLCAVNLSNLVFKILPEDQTSESDQELYEIDERENYHYNQELKDYDIAEVLGDGFKFEPSLCWSKQQIQSMISALQPQQFSKNNNYQERNKQQNFGEYYTNKSQDYQKQQASNLKYRISDDSPNEYDQSKQYQNFDSRDAPRSAKNNSHRNNQRGTNNNNNPPGYFKQQFESPAGMQFPSFQNPMHPYSNAFLWMNNQQFLTTNLPKNSTKGSRNSNNNNHNFRDNQTFDTNNYQMNNNSSENYSSNGNNMYPWGNTQGQYNQTNSSNHPNSNNNNYNQNSRQVYSNTNSFGNNQQQQSPNGNGNQSFNHSKRKKHYSSRAINNQSDNNQTTSVFPSMDSSNYLQNKGNSNEKTQTNQGSFSNTSQNETSSSYHNNQAKQKSRSNKKTNPASNKHTEFNQVSSTQIPVTGIQYSLNPVGNQLKRTKDMN